MSEKFLIQADKRSGIRLVSHFMAASGDFIETDSEVWKRLKDPASWPFCGAISQGMADKVMKADWNASIGDDRFLPSHKKYFRPKPPPMPGGTERASMKIEILSESD